MTKILEQQTERSVVCRRYALAPVWRLGPLVLALVVICLALCLETSHAGNVTGDEAGVARAAAASFPARAPYFISTIDTVNDVGEHVSIALDPASGTTYISYYDATYLDLKMAQSVVSGGNCGPGNSWRCETVDSVGDVGKYSSIAVDPTDGYPIIAYHDTTNRALKLAIGSAVGWIFKTIQVPLFGSAGQYASLALDATGKTQIAYYYSNLLGTDSLWHVAYVGGGAGDCTDPDYQCDLIDSGDQVGKHASLALDSLDLPHIAYQDTGNNLLKYARKLPNDFWSRRIIIPTSSGAFASLFVDTDNGDLPHVAHLDSVNETLEYAVYVGSGGNCGFNGATAWEWQCDDIDTVGAGSAARGVAIAVDEAGRPFIAYQSGASGLMTARPVTALGNPIGNCGPTNLFFTWQCDLLSLGIGIVQADYVSLAVNASGLASIAYHGESIVTAGNLRLASQRLQVFVPVALKE
jgi:hypothetical protein